MVAVTLSPEVRPLDMMMNSMQPLLQFGGTTPAATSVDDHIARLKANARQHVAREMQGHPTGKEASKDNNGEQQQNDSIPTSPRGQKNPYLPPPEVAKTIACRFFPNCNYGEQCIFWHPPSAHANGASPATMSSNNGTTPNLVAAPVFGGEGQQAVNGGDDAAPSSSSSSLSNGNGHTLNGSAPSHANHHQHQDDAGVQPSPMMYPGTMPYDMAAAYGQGNQAAMYYVSAGYDATGMSPEYMGYATSPYASQHAQSFQSPSPANGQQQQQQAGTVNGNTNTYYGFVPYGSQGGYPYPSQGVGYVQHPYYAQQQPGASYPGIYQNGNGLPDEPANSHLNGLSSPTSASSSSAIADPAIISQGPESQSQSYKSAGNTAVKDQGSSSSQMEKSGSNQSNESGKSASGKKAAKKAAAAGASFSGNGQHASTSSPAMGNGQTAEFVPVPYYAAPGVPSEIFGMIPPQFQQIPAQYASYTGAAAQLQHQQPPMSQAELEAEFAKVSLANGIAPATTAIHDLQKSQSQESAGKRSATSPTADGHGHGHGRAPSSGQMHHTFFQTSGGTAGASGPGSSVAPASTTASLAASTSATRAPANGRPGQVAGSSNGYPSRRSGDFHPSSSVSAGQAQGKRFPPFGASNGANRAGPSTNPSSFPRNAHTAPGPRPPFDPSKPLPNCRYFDMRSCRHGDLCHFVHYLHTERALPGSAAPANASTGADNNKPTMTRDARLLGLNIGGPDGTISEKHARHPAEYRRPSVSGPSMNGGQLPQQNGQHFAPQGYPHAAPKGRFVHGPHPSSAAFSAQQQQQQQHKQQEIARLANSGNSADAQEKIQRLISETRNLPSTATSAASVTRAGAASSTAPRNNPIPASLGRRPPPMQRGHGGPSAQRVPSGENDFPALSSGGVMGRSSSNTSQPKSDEPIQAQLEAPALSDKASPSPATNAEGPAATDAPSDAPKSTPAPTSQTAPMPASKPPAFSWASAAAKAASLPTPPAPKRAPSKPRASASGAKENSKDEKPSKGERSAKVEKTVPKVKGDQAASDNKDDSIPSAPESSQVVPSDA